MGTSLRTLPKLQLTHLVAVTTVAVVALCLRAAGALLDHSGARLAGDVLIVFGLLIPSLSIMRRFKDHDPLPPSSFLRSRIAIVLADVGWTVLCISAVQLATSAPVGATWRSAFFDPLIAGSGLQTLCIASSVISLSLIVYAIEAVLSCYRSRSACHDSLYRTALMAQAVLTCLCAPVLLLVSLLALGERVLHLGILSTESTLTTQLGWIALHPLLLSALLPILGQTLDSFGVTAFLSKRLARLALWSFALLSILSYGQNAFDAGLSELHAILASFYAALTCAPLLTLFAIGCEAAVRALGRRKWPLKQYLSVLCLVGCAAFLPLALSAALPPLSLGFDIVLFGSHGRTVLLGLVLLGLALSVLSIRTDSTDSAEQAVRASK